MAPQFAKESAGITVLVVNACTSLVVGGDEEGGAVIVAGAAAGGSRAGVVATGEGVMVATAAVDVVDTSDATSCA